MSSHQEDHNAITPQPSTHESELLNFARHVLVYSGHHPEEFNNVLNSWALQNTASDPQRLAAFVGEYIAKYQPQIPFVVTYQEYAKMTEMLPSKAGRKINIVLTRNDARDLLFSIEGETNVTRFGLPEEMMK